MDRNRVAVISSVPSIVALRKESVDRNWTRAKIPVLCIWSLSARRAWIEIIGLYSSLVVFHVALRKESVDRNCYRVRHRRQHRLSLSARRAWIEIGIMHDRDALGYCRSPQGERG